jgi:hypothetical protein
MAAMPEAPASAHSAEFWNVTPPRARTGSSGSGAGFGQRFESLAGECGRAGQGLFEDWGEESDGGSGGAGGEDVRDCVTGDADRRVVTRFAVRFPVFSDFRHSRR